MRTFSLICSMALVIAGMYNAMFIHNFAGVFLMVIGGLGYIIISADTEKKAGYNKKDFMNR